MLQQDQNSLGGERERERELFVVCCRKSLIILNYPLSILTALVFFQAQQVQRFKEACKFSTRTNSVSPEVVSEVVISLR